MALIENGESSIQIDLRLTHIIMKCLRLACLCILWASPAILHAQSGIQMVSQSYSISASWNDTWLWSPDTIESSVMNYPLGDWSAGYSAYPLTGGYNLSSSDGTPVAASTAAPSPVYCGWQGNPNPNSPLNASASVDLFSVQIKTFALEYGIPPELPAPIGGYAFQAYPSAIETSVQGDWLFHPAGNSLDVSINATVNSAWFEENYAVTLTDLTTSTTLLNFGSATNGGGGFTLSDALFAVNPSDVYEFNISQTAGTYNNDFLDESFTASIISVPEPGVWALLSLGLTGLFGLRSRHRKQQKLENRKRK